MSEDRELSPEQEARVRRLLAEARVDEPIPGDVAGRLDRVLARLADGEPDHDCVGVVDLADRRRRKLTALLVAAAAVVAVGAGAAMLRPDDLSPAADGMTSATGPDPAAAEDRPDAGAGGGAQEAAPAEAPPGALSLNSTTDSTSGRLGGPARIRPAFFAADVERVRSTVLASTYRDASPEPAPEDDSADELTAASRAEVCEPGAWGPGELYLVRYAGTPAVLALRPAAGETQVVDLLQCGTADILRSVTLPGS